MMTVYWPHHIRMTTNSILIGRTDTVENKVRGGEKRTSGVINSQRIEVEEMRKEPITIPLPPRVLTEQSLELRERAVTVKHSTMTNQSSS